MMKSKMRNIVFTMVVIVAVLFYTFFTQRSDGLLHIVFCDVGQGDAIYMRFPNGTDVLVDAGKGKDVLNCLGEYMPFWDRTIELVFLTHPQYDHYGGLASVFKRYNIGLFLIPPIGSETDSFKQVMSLVEEKSIKTQNLFTGDSIRFKKQYKPLSNYIKRVQENTDNSSTIDVLWPEKQWVISHSVEPTNQVDNLHSKQPSRRADSSIDLNDFSYTLLVSLGSFDVLLTGDAETSTIEPAVSDYFSQNPEKTDPIEVLKVSHHGSVGAVNTVFLDLIRPSIGVLSVGKNNKYGHPAKSVVEELEKAKILVKRTDEDGSIEIVSDGKSWKIEQ